MRDYQKEFDARVAFIRALVADAHVSGIVFGNSGGKDCALVGILCKAACDDTVGVLMPCASGRNFGSDTDDALAVSAQFGIEARRIDLTAARQAMLDALPAVTEMTDAAIANIAPRLRMTTLYAIAGSENRLVAGTGNRSERYMGYFTKWGDGACDFNPIADLTVTEVYEFLEFLRAPRCIIDKAPSAGLFEGQTDEQEMGVTYAAVDEYILHGTGSEQDRAVIERYHARAGHKLRLPPVFDESVSD
ncbi:MAG: NAD(+) synthase [Ruminococcaceae bacterium]|nr:NAD(+) synthase [Oscillospiraceae bacterium]